MNYRFFLLAIFMCANCVLAKHDHFSEKQIGEYYEFDIEGNNYDQIRRRISFHSKQVIKAPFKATRFCFRTTKDFIKGMAHDIELFLSDSHSIDGNQNNLHHALKSWSEDSEIEAYVLDEPHVSGTNCIIALPHAALKLLKNTLYAVGIRLPRATWRTVKSFASGVSDCARI
ncbi:MAG: hypothetical protein KC505_06685 [Myxococcales bacterium]|nr:hypothetical protein [Myxococcales bacterium]USN49928.1 MAG: hypothetical protein H6731_06505 [Myxococcales bacterium]